MGSRHDSNGEGVPDRPCRVLCHRPCHRLRHRLRQGPWRRLYRSGLVLLALVMLPACQDPGQGAAGETERPVSRPRPDAPARTPSPERLLLPNLRSLPAEDVHIRVEDGRRELRFAALLANVGAGPLIVRPEREAGPCPEGRLHSVQMVRRRDGPGHRLFPGGCMLDHPTHDHWHFDAMARYWLTRRASRAALVEWDKVSFCLRDSRRVPGERWADVPRTYGECTADGVQGISPGWIDRYRSGLPGQGLPLPDGFADGLYCLRLAADPHGLLRESDEHDNASALAVRITGDQAVPRPSVPCD